MTVLSKYPEAVIYGAGGHAAVVIDTMRQSRQFRPAACLDRHPGSALFGVPVLGEEIGEELFAKGVRLAFIGVGETALRERLARRAIEAGFELISVVSPRAYVSSLTKIGKGVLVAAGAVVQPGVSVGDLAIVNTAASVDHDCQIGEAAHVAPGVTLCGNVMIGLRTWVGAGSTVVERVRIGNDVFIAAGSVVVEHVADHMRIAGVPARAMPSNAN